ncbi:hypothetical protein PG994_003964 [Apiospora phragmitis]|uniref:Uncharacterized protein n=1 Tax=Apiospora phragmitis TaxID=2905665 RepID=A0ABR1VZP8_9PEZI
MSRLLLEQEKKKKKKKKKKKEKTEQQQRPYYQLPTTKLCIPDHPATFGCKAGALLRDSSSYRGEAERVRVEAADRRLRRLYREALQEAIVKQQD